MRQTRKYYYVNVKFVCWLSILAFVGLAAWHAEAVPTSNTERLINRLPLQAVIATGHGRYAEAVEPHGADYSRTKKHLEQALEIRLNLFGEYHVDTAASLNNLGVYYHDLLRNYTRAKEHYLRALAIQLRLFSEEQVDIAASLDDFLIGFGDFVGRAAEQDIRRLRIVLGRTMLGEEHSATATILGNLGLACKNLGQENAAIFYLKMSVNDIQSVSGSLAALWEGSVQKIFIQFREIYYHTLADLLVGQGRIPEALQVLAMLKEEEYFNFILRDARDDPRTTRVSYTPREQEQVDRFKKIAEQLFNLSEEKRGLPGVDKERLEEINSALESLTRELHDFFENLEANLKTGTAEQATAAGIEFLEDIQQMLKGMGDGVALVHTLIAPEHVWLILTTYDAQTHVRKNIRQRELFEKIRTFRVSLTYRDNQGRPAWAPLLLPTAQALYDILIAPISEDLKKAGIHTLMFFLDGALRYIPISALHDGQQWLVEKYAVVVYTDAARENLRSTRPPVETWEAAAMGVTEAHRGFSELPAVRNELESIVRRIDSTGNAVQGIFPGIILMDKDFTEDALIDALNRDIPLVHIASHFKLELGNITNSYLLLGDGQRLTLERLRDGNFRFEKVDQLTLSACDTAIELREGAGSELEGLGVLVQRKGASSVIATLWPIADESTGVFLPRFYELLLQGGMTRAEALRQTQIEFMKPPPEPSLLAAMAKFVMERLGHETAPPPDYSHPFFWAPFILMGNWL